MNEDKSLTLTSILSISHFTNRFKGRDCSFPVSHEDLAQFVVQASRSPCGDDQLQEYFEELQRQSGLTSSLNWESGVENYMKLKSMADI